MSNGRFLSYPISDEASCKSVTQGAGLVLDYAGTTNSLYTIAVNKNKHTLRPFQM